MNPFTSVWLHPKQTTRYVIENKSTTYSIVLAIVGFMASGILMFQDSGMYPDVPYLWIALASIFGMPIVGIIIYFIGVGITYIVGKWFKGVGSFWEIGKAVSLSYIPTIVTWPLYILWLIIAPESLLVMEAVDAFAVVMMIVMVVTSIWSIVIMIGAVAEAHQYSNWRAFFTLVIPGLVIAIVIAIILVVIFFAVISVFV